MKKMKTAIVLALGLITLPAVTMAGVAFYDKAKVISTAAIYETVEVAQPEQRCWNEQVRHERAGRRGSYTPTIAGAIVGGVVGNQFGNGRGKDVMTVAGALLGASVGHDISRTRGRRSYLVTERRCETVTRYVEEERQVGYRVKYRYRGRVFTTRTEDRPGKHLRIRVNVEPAAGYAFNDRN